MIETNPLYPTKVIHLFPKDVINDWIENERETVFKKGELIVTPDKLTDAAYLIKNGNAIIYQIHIDGKECVLGLVATGEFVDLMDIFSAKESSIFCKALTDVTVAIVPKKKIQTFVKQNPAIAINLLNYYSDRYKEIVEILEQVAYGKVEERLVFLLKKLSNLSEADGEWHPLPISITHKDIAGMVASTRETVTLLINKLLHSGVIRQYQDRLWIRF